MPSSFFNVNRASPVNWAHPLNRGRVTWLMALPGFTSGGKTWFDLVRTTPQNAAVQVFDANNGFRGSARSGGSSHLLCDGSTGYASSSLSISGVLTVSCWVRLLANGSFTYFVGDVLNFVGLRVPSGTSPSMCDATAEAVSSVAIGNSWAHVVGTLDGANPTVFVNGVQTGQAADTAVGWSGLVVGARGSGGNLQNCEIDDVSLWNRVLSVQEIASLYHLSSRGYGSLLNRFAVPQFGVTAAGISVQQMLMLMGVGS